MAHAQKPEVTAEQINHAKDLWVGFTKFIKFLTLGTIAVIVLLALITL